MGWSSGTYIMDTIIAVTMREIHDSSLRRKLYLGYIEALTENDWDTVNECFGEDPAFDMAATELGYGE